MLKQLLISKIPEMLEKDIIMYSTAKPFTLYRTCEEVKSIVDSFLYVNVMDTKEYVHSSLFVPNSNYTD